MKDDLQPIRWGVAGPGHAAARFAEGLRAVQGASLAAVWGRNPQRAQAYALRFRVPQVFDCQVPGHGLQFVSRHSLQFSDAGMKIYLAGEAEAGSAGEQPAKE